MTGSSGRYGGVFRPRGDAETAHEWTCAARRAAAGRRRCGPALRGAAPRRVLWGRLSQPVVGRRDDKDGRALAAGGARVGFASRPVTAHGTGNGGRGWRLPPTARWSKAGLKPPGAARRARLEPEPPARRSCALGISLGKSKVTPLEGSGREEAILQQLRETGNTFASRVPAQTAACASCRTGSTSKLSRRAGGGEAGAGEIGRNLTDAEIDDLMRCESSARRGVTPPHHARGRGVVARRWRILRRPLPIATARCVVGAPRTGSAAVVGVGGISTPTPRRDVRRGRGPGAALHRLVYRGGPVRAIAKPPMTGTPTPSIWIIAFHGGQIPRQAKIDGEGGRR